METQIVKADSKNVIDLSGGGEVAKMQQMDSMLGVEQSKQLAEVQAAVFLAKKFPRNEAMAIEKIVNECRRPTLAAVSVYSYSKGGTEINSASIRLLEAIKRHWGNIQSGFRIIESNPGSSTVQAYAWDQENNVREEKVFVVKHVRTAKKVSYPVTDERDIYELVANQSMRRVRSCIASVIPGDVIDMAMAECERTLSITMEVTEERIAAMINAFAVFGIDRSALEKRVQRNLSTISPAQFASLQKIHNSLRDQMSKPSDWFEITAPQEQDTTAKKLGAVKESLAAKQSGEQQSTVQEGGEQTWVP